MAKLDPAATAGVLLMVVAAIAVVWANVAPDGYAAVWRRPLTVGVAALALSKPLLQWINDGLMAIFFFVVGLEIRREIDSGEMASRRKAVLPVIAAVGGMVVPAAIYASLNAGAHGSRGWGIPMATDIAFALGALALLGRRVAPALRVFLTAVAIADDLGAIAVIALFYAHDLALLPLALGVVMLGVVALLTRFHARHAALYVVLGIAVWVAFLKSGVHATVAGVLLAFVVPTSARVEHALQPFVAYLIMPIFALANAGVTVRGSIAAAMLEPIALGTVLGLFVGKQLGVAGCCWASARLGWAALPTGASWRQLYGVALLCGIGFTMSLFIATLAFEDAPRLDAAKIGVLAGSLFSGVAGCIVLARSR